MIKHLVYTAFFSLLFISQSIGQVAEIIQVDSEIKTLSSMACADQFAGNVSIGEVDAQSSTVSLPGPIFLCYLDRFVVENSNADLTGDPDATTQPGVGYAFFDCPPIATGPMLSAIESDPCVLDNPAPPATAAYDVWVYTGQPNGSALFQNSNQLGGQTIPEFFNGGDPVQIYFAPITFDDFGNNLDEDGGDCVNMNADEAFPVVYLNPIEITNCQVDFVNNQFEGSFTITGGISEYNGSTYPSVSVVRNNNFNNQAEIINGPFMHGDVVNFVTSTPGNYSLLVEDAVSCGGSKILPILQEDKEMSISVNIPPGPFNPGDNVCASFCVADFDSITSMEFTINFDPTVLEYDASVIGPLEDLSTGNIVTVFADAGQMPFSWFQNAATGVDLVDGTCIFDICFTVVGNPGECSDVFLDGTPTAINVGCCEQDLPVELIYTNGEICIEEPSDIEIYAGSCGANNGDEGSINFTIVGGSPPYQYGSNCFANGTISTSGQQVNIGGLTAGACTIDVFDAAGNTASIMIDVNNDAPIEYEVFTKDPTCYGQPNARIAIRDINGGDPDYYLSWSNGFYGVDSIMSLPGGIYFVTIEDENGCEVEEVVVVGTDPILVDINIVDTTSCVTSNDGIITADASGGTPVNGNRYTYQWSSPSLIESNVVISENVDIPTGLGTVRVTDDNGCSVTIEYDMPFEKEVTADITVVQPQCADSLGSIVVTGGTTNGTCGQFTFDWSGGIVTANNQTTSFANDLMPGDYTVTITDCDGCFIDTLITIDSPAPLTLPTIVDFDCSSPTGCITVFPGGGQNPITLSWSDDATATNSIRCGLLPGTYGITATDANGCTTSVSVDLGEGTAVVIDSLFVTPVECAGDENGIITADVIGGGPYTYLWDGPFGMIYPDTETITDLGAGWYYVTVEDNSNCLAIDSVEIIAPDTILLSPDITLPVCNGESNGTIALVVSGGDNSIGYVYSWNNFPTVFGPVLNNVGPGSYDVRVFDSAGCSKDTTIVMPDQEVIDINVNILQEILCNGENNAIVEVEFGGGKVDNGNYGTVWSSGETEGLGTIATDTSFLTGAGTNSVIIFDQECADTLEFQVMEPSPITLDINNTVVTPASCFGVCDGTAEVSASGGTGVLDFTWVDSGVNNALITNLCNGFHVVEIIDENGCIVADSVFVTEPDSLDLFVDIFNTFNPACSNEGDGVITVDYIGGNAGPVTYTWTDGVSDDATAIDLSNGTYGITITDINGCTDTTSYSLLSAPPVFGDVPSPVEPLCFGDQTCISVENPSGGTGTGYRFSINNSNLFPIDSCVQVFAGQYTISIFDSDGCAYDTTILINQPSEYLVSLGGDLLVGLGDSTTVVGVQLNSDFVVDTLIWSGTQPYECFDDDCDQIYVYPAVDAVYTVTAVSVEGCAVTDEVVVRIDDERRVFIPNAFTPNGDGINDVFQLFTGRGVEEIVIFQVYDRWGNKMFEAVDVAPNPGGTLGWDGKFNGQGLDPGVYTYRAEISFIDGKTVPYSGSITLIR